MVCACSASGCRWFILSYDLNHLRERFCALAGTLILHILPERCRVMQGHRGVCPVTYSSASLRRQDTSSIKRKSTAASQQHSHTMFDHGAALLEQPDVENSAQAKTNPSLKHGKCSHTKHEVRRATTLLGVPPLSRAHFSAIRTLAHTGRPVP